MNWSDILTIVASALATFLFGEKLYSYFFLKQDKRSKEADNEAKVVENLERALNLIQNQLEKSNKDSSEKQEIIVAQQKELFTERDMRAKIQTELEVTKCRECRVHGCMKREPQSGY